MCRFGLIPLIIPFSLLPVLHHMASSFKDVLPYSLGSGLLLKLLSIRFLSFPYTPCALSPLGPHRTRIEVHEVIATTLSYIYSALPYSLTFLPLLSCAYYSRSSDFLHAVRVPHKRDIKKHSFHSSLFILISLQWSTRDFKSEPSIFSFFLGDSELDHHFLSPSLPFFFLFNGFSSPGRLIIIDTYKIC